ncbi:MAG: saccharopine dehydrogenase NADP-binding domain-containing protein [Sphingomonadaceae bacterium]
MSAPRVLLYGATGRSGRALAEALAADLGPRLLLGGRDPARLAAVAGPLGLDSRAFGLADAAAVVRALAGVRLVLNAAGPFATTAAPLIEACLAAHADYADIAGEWPVFAAAMARHDAARAAGVRLLPGAALIVAASDCLLAEAAAPGVVRLALGVSRPHALTAGSWATALSLFDGTTLVRRDGALVRLPLGSLSDRFDFGAGPVRAVSVPFPDVVIAPHATAVADLATFAEAGDAGLAAARLAAPVAPLARALSPLLAPLLAGEPTPDSGVTFIVHAEDRWRRRTIHRLRTLDGYAATIAIARLAVARLLALPRGQGAGFATPARLFGPDFLHASGATRPLPTPAGAGDAAVHRFA